MSPGGVVASIASLIIGATVLIIVVMLIRGER